MLNADSYTTILKSALEERTGANPAYSLRAFARDLGIKAPNLSAILNGKKGISETKAMEVCEKLGFSDIETSYFCDLVNAKHAKSSLKRNLAKSRIKTFYNQNEVKIIKEDTFKIISDWYHYAILELILTEDFLDDPAPIAKRLGINSFQAREALDRLERLELIGIKNGKILSTGIQLETTNGLASNSIKKLNTQLLEKAKESITNQNVDERHLSTLTLAINKEDVKEYGSLIEEFKAGINTLSMKKNKAKKPDEVYCLSTQFFKLTKS